MRRPVEVSFEFDLRIRFVRRMFNTPPQLTSNKIQNISPTVHLGLVK